MSDTKTDMKKILIVEDEADAREALVDKFTRSGFEVFSAVNGEVGLSMAFEHHPDIILLDLIMPEKDGFAMLESLRKDDWGKDALVMILTNLAGTTKTIANILDKDVHEYLVKTSWTINDVVERVKQSLKTHIGF